MNENVAVLFGGASVEHDISIITAMQVIALLEEDYNVIPVYVTKEGEWLTGKMLNKLQNFGKNLNKQKTVRVHFITRSNYIYREKRQGHLVPYCKVDVAFIAMHGGEGENGGVQGLLRSAGVPFTGCNVLQSAVTMDKAICKTLLKSYGFDVCKGVVIDREHFLDNSPKAVMSVPKKIAENCIVKPCSLGSSIGITRCANREEVEIALNTVFTYDSRAIIEEFIENAEELNCASAKIDGGYKISCVCKVENGGAVYTFDQKYLNKGKFSTNQSIIPAQLEEEVQKATLKISELFGFSGVVRVDYLKKDDILYVNEINSIPGSMAMHLYASSELKDGGLLKGIICSAKSDCDKESKLQRVFNSTVLNGANNKK